MEGKYNSFYIRSAYATGVYWAPFVKAKTVPKMCFESFSAIAHVAAALSWSDGIFRTPLTG